MGRRQHRAFCVSPLINPASPWIRTFTEYAKDWDWDWDQDWGGNNREEIASLIEGTIARDKLCAFHLNLIEHGRRICTARKPKCDDCVLKDYCYCYC